MIFTIGLTAQSHPWEVRFSHQIEAEIAEGKIRPARAATLYSFLGEYYTSCTYSDIPVSWGVDELDLGGLETDDALPYIVEAAKDHQVVIISENHQRPQHRIFASEIITELANQGFEHLGLETFGNYNNGIELLDSNLSERGYPLNSPMTGTYTMEPQMGNLVRDAIRLNFNLFAYEGGRKVPGKDRDEIQADNIIQYIKQNPNEKIIIYCGWHHAVESDTIKRGTAHWMAYYLKEKTGIDPLTIYQDNFTEKYIENEHPILEEIDIDKPSVFIDENNQVYRCSDHVDMEIIHPKTTYRNGRPSWLYRNDAYKPVKIKIRDFNVDLPAIIAAYPLNEENSVPIDRIELKHKFNLKVLVLPLGEYRIEIFDGENRIEYLQTVY